MPLYPFLKPLLFAVDPETAHELALRGMAFLEKFPGFSQIQHAWYGYEHPALRIRLWGMELDNPVGLAAGFDKDGRVLGAMKGLGFGFLEAGTVTPRPQPGNPRPRLFRLPTEEGLINRMGFNNGGAAALANRLRALQERARESSPKLLVGVNLGKNLDTSLEDAAEDYLSALGMVYDVADYLTLNVSSPNTPGLRGLQARRELSVIAGALAGERDRLSAKGAKRVPLLIKVAPDLDETGLAEVVEVALETGCDGLIATNTTVSRDGLSGSPGSEAGGLSGRPLHGRALETVTALYRISGGRLPLLGVGGISGPEEAYAFIRAGASAVQLYSGLIFQGPGLVRSVKEGLVRLLNRDGFSTLAEAVGSGQ